MVGSKAEVISSEAHEDKGSAVLMMPDSRFLFEGTDKGILCMKNKYDLSEFGRCPRELCCGHSCLPIGLSDVPGASSVKIYCPKCDDVYHPPPSKHQGLTNIDGAYFGTAFPHLFLMNYPYIKELPPQSYYVPRLFGFKLHNPSREH